MALPENIKLALELIGVDHASVTIDEAGESLREYVEQSEEAGKASKDAANKSSMSWTEFRSVYSTVLEVGQGVLKMWNDTVGVTVDLAGQVRELKDVTGLSAEESSRLVDVLEHYKVSASAAGMATKKLAAEDMQFNIETLAKLSDEYLSLNTDIERTNFLYEKFGKSGTDFAEIMLAGSDAIKEMNDTVPEMLVLTEKQIKAARDYEIALDELNDSVMGLKVSIGNQLIPTFNTLIDLQNKKNEIIEEGNITYSRAANYAAALALKEEYAAESLQDVADGMEDASEAADTLTVSTEEAAAKMEELSAANQEFLSILGNVQSASDSYAEKYQKINSDMSLSDEERKQQLQELAAEHELANRKIILGMLERKLTQDGILDDAELDWLLEKGMAWGIYSQTVVDETRAVIAEANTLASTLNTIPSNITTTIDIITNGAPPNLSMSNTPAPVGTRRRNADGGTYMIPMSWGNEGLPIGTSDTASGGELISITPKGQDPNSELIQAIERNRTDERRLAKYIVTAMAQVGR